jgi:L-alanine-DL-glutamate epimerase-like enolase superfamily enzyme
MNLHWEIVELQLKYPFTISRGSRNSVPVVIVHFEHDSISGVGEASPSSRYGENISTICEYLSNADLSKFDDPFKLEDILEYLDRSSSGNNSAKTAIDIALNDWLGKKLNVPLYTLWGLDRHKTPITSMTIGIDNPEQITRKIREAEEFPILKIKLGGSNDEEIIKAVRDTTDRLIRVDANEGWKTKDEALHKIKWLSEMNVEFIEQPMPAAQVQDIQWLHNHSPLPLIADESCMVLSDIPTLKGAFDGINIKLMKCGGLREAIKMIHTARAMGLKIMLGCMIETSIGISAAAQISPLVDYADLDGSILTTNDPFDGVHFDKGKIILTNESGIGIKKK